MLNVVAAYVLHACRFDRHLESQRHGRVHRRTAASVSGQVRLVDESQDTQIMIRH